MAINSSSLEGVVTTLVGSSSACESLIMQRDGKILLAGYSQEPYQKVFTLVRYNSNGALDSTFNYSGIVTTNFGNSSLGYSVIEQPDGKILLAGTSGGLFSLVRYNINGIIDSTFGIRGRVTTDVGSGNEDYIKSIAIQPDGKILAAGSASVTVGKYVRDDFAVVRYNSDGSLDNTFGSQGKVITNSIGNWDSLSQQSTAESIAVQADGKILVAGASQYGYGSHFALVRYNSDGSLDATFSNDGKLTTDFQTYVWGSCLTIQPDGKILVDGYSYSGEGFSLLVRYEIDGRIDTTFGTNGIVKAEISNGLFYQSKSITTQTDGKIISVGSIYDPSNGNRGFALIRFSSDGSLDNTFGIGGKVTVYVGSTSTDINSVTIQPDGKILVAGTIDKQFAVTRFNENGVLDVSFADFSPPSVSSFSPAFGTTGIAIGSDIVVTFSEAIKFGSGNIEIHAGSAAGTLLAAYNVASPSTNLSISGSTLTINPTNDLAYSTDYYVTFASGAIKDIAGNSYAGTTNYDFVTAPSTIIGTSSNDVLNGTAGDDSIYGMGGNDTLNGALGNDSYYVDAKLPGNVAISDTGGNDAIYFNTSGLSYKLNNDSVEFSRGGTGNTNLVVQIFHNGAITNTFTINNEYSGTQLATNTAIETITVSGQGNNDISFMPVSILTLIGGYTSTAANQLIVGGAGDDTLTASYDTNHLYGGSGDDTLTGSSTNDKLSGGLGIDIFNVTAGSSKVGDLGYGGADILKVSSGATASVDIFSSGWVATSSSFNNGIAKIHSYGYTVNLSAISTGNGFQISNESLSTGASLSGSGLDDKITGATGNDTITGGAGSDLMNGGEGSDVYIIALPIDHPVAEVADTGTSGTDEVRFTSTTANATLTFYAGDIGIEKVTIGTGTAASAVTTGTTALNVDASLVVNALTITGNAGNNILKSGLGVDTLVGGAGNDTYVVDLTTAGAIQDTITEAVSAGTDTVQLRGTSTNVSAVTLTLATNLENLDASNTSTSLLNLTGNTANNTLTGNAANNILDGGTGTDTLIGGAGNDTYVVDSTTDTITELTDGGTDLVQSSVTFSLAAIANVENLTLTGTSAINGTGNTLANTLTGNTGANSLSGGDGNDKIIGGKGADSLTGGTGSDTFSFSAGDSGQTSNYDLIIDFAKGAVGTGDLIDYSSNLTIGGSAATATSTQAAINMTSANATFASGSGTTLTDALGDISAKFTAATNSQGEFALFQVNRTGDYYVFISDGTAGVTANDVVIDLVGITTISQIDLTGGNLTIMS